MQEIALEVTADHVRKQVIGRISVPRAVEELVWNALDGNARSVRVRLDRRALGAVDQVVIEDDGDGITEARGMEAFAKLGASWKRNRRQTRDGRPLHGRWGHGRFAAFTIGEYVTWHTSYADEGSETWSYMILGRLTNPALFEVSKPGKVDGKGTVVAIANVFPEASDILLRASTFERLNITFAQYLLKYPDVSITYDSTTLNPSDEIEFEAKYAIEATHSDHTISGELRIIEWSRKAKREIVLCDPEGVAIRSVAQFVQAPEFEYTAFINAEYFSKAADTAMMDVAELDPKTNALIESAKAQMREHFAERRRTRGIKLVDQWKQDEVYPYGSEPDGAIEKMERDVFDEIAITVNHHGEGLAGSERRLQQTTLQLLKAALETGPQELEGVLTRIADLPDQHVKRLSKLLDKTSIAGLIKMSRMVLGRLDFLKGLETLIFDPKTSKRVLERRHLHKIVAQETWIFGERYAAMASDRDLTTVLRHHRDELELDFIVDDEPPAPEGKASGIVDLALSRASRRAPDNLDYLVVELKRSSRKITPTDLQQTRGYALTVSSDSRFHHNRVRWVFWVIGFELHPHTQREARQRDKPPGLIAEFENADLWVKTWAEVIAEARDRMEFLRDRLEYAATEETGLEYLRDNYAEYLPDGT